jgi:DNA-binding beta-propeller fold protein YncE
MVIALARAEAHSASPASAQPAQPDRAQPDRLEALLDVGQAPVQLTLKPDGGEVFVSNSLANSISEVFATTDEVSGATLIGNYPVRGLVSADNAILYVANFHSQYVTLYSIDEGQRLKPSIRVGDGPTALAFSTAGHLLFVVDANSNDVAVVRTSSRSLFTMLPASRSPNAIAVKAFNQF